MSSRLKNIRVMVTRPVEQATDLIEQINDAGGNASSFPALAIQSNPNSESIERCKFVSGYDWIIFISQNAVRYALSLLPISDWPTTTKIAAVGPTTSNALQQAGLQVNKQPVKAMNSESLLEAFAEEDLNDKKVLIIRGVGGREKLANGFKEMGALVDYAEVYNRYCPELDNSHLLNQFEQGVDVITIASGETLQNFAELIESSTLNDQQKNKLYTCPLIIVSERIKVIAERLGFLNTVIVKEPENKGVVNAIEEWQNENLAETVND